MKNKMDPIASLIKTTMWGSVLLPTGILFAVWYGSITTNDRNSIVSSICLLILAIIVVSIPFFLFLKAYLTMYGDYVANVNEEQTESTEEEPSKTESAE